MKQLIEDAKLILGTDKRLWAGGIFILVVLIMWSLTDSWRPPIEIPPEKTIRIETNNKVKGSKLPASEGMVQDLSGLSVANEKLKADINRVSEELNSKQEEISWQMEGLVSKLSTINASMEDITQKIGANKIQEVEREHKQKPKKLRGHRPDTD
jgi:hypothetical protein